MTSLRPQRGASTLSNKDLLGPECLEVERSRMLRGGGGGGGLVSRSPPALISREFFKFSRDFLEFRSVTPPIYFLIGARGNSEVFTCCEKSAE